MSILTAPRDRVITGLALLGVVLVVGFIDNFFVMWLFLGGIYIVAFYEAMRLFGIKNNDLVYFAVALWLLGAIYPHTDDLDARIPGASQRQRL